MEAITRGAWQEMQERWDRFARWEEERVRSSGSTFAAAVQWLDDARQLAAGMDPDWGSRSRAEEHWRDLARDQALLARIDLSR